MRATVQAELPIFKGERLTSLPDDLFIPPNALELFLEDFSGPMDVLLSGSGCSAGCWPPPCRRLRTSNESAASVAPAGGDTLGV